MAFKHKHLLGIQPLSPSDITVILDTAKLLSEISTRDVKKDAIIMHPGPINRDVKISTDLADSVKSVILRQVENGIAVRMAVLYLLLGGKEREITD